MAYIVYSETTRIIDAAFVTLTEAQAHVDSHEEDLTADSTDRTLPDEFQPGVWHFHADGTIAPDPPAATIQLTLRRDFLLDRCRYWMRVFGMPFFCGAEGDKLQAYGLHLEGCVRAILVDANLTNEARHAEIKAELDQDPKAWVRLGGSTAAASWVAERPADRSGWEWHRTNATSGEANPTGSSEITLDVTANWITALIG